MDRGVFKRVGRFISRTDDLVSVISLRPFSFEEICEKDQIQADNPAGNLIYTRFHSKKELRASVTEHESMHEELRDPQNIAPILQPIDFTSDWRRHQERQSKKAKGRTDEDDEYELEYEQMILQQQMRGAVGQEDGASPTAVVKTESKPVAPAAGKAAPSSNVVKKSANAATAVAPKHIAPLTDLEVTQDDLNKSKFVPLAEGMMQVGQAIKRANVESNLAEDAKPLVIQRQTDAVTEPAVNAAGVPSAPIVQQPELEAMRAYREVLNNPDLSPANIREQVESAKAQGYQDGFRQGEEKATLQLQGLSQQVVSSVETILTELGDLRGQILKGAEQNFREVCQALSEALIQRELSVSPDAFKAIVDRIVKDAITQDQFKIAVHPQLYAVLKKANLGTLADKIYEDQNVNPGEFRVESQQAIVDGNIKKIIEDLLHQADLSLFDSDKKAG